MKYKVGDKVKIRTWKSMEKEYGLDSDGDISPSKMAYYFTRIKEKELNEESSDRILTIKEVEVGSYRMKELDSCWYWDDWMIEELVEDYVESILTRFEILDL